MILVCFMIPIFGAWFMEHYYLENIEILDIKYFVQILTVVEVYYASFTTII